MASQPTLIVDIGVGDAHVPVIVPVMRSLAVRAD
jgi:hypothetical protein